MGLTTGNVTTLKKKVSMLNVDQKVKKFLVEFIEALKSMDNASSDQTAGETGSVTAGASSEALTVKDGLITSIG